jgi:sirohydrochlorin cobaltochelatase
MVDAYYKETQTTLMPYDHTILLAHGSRDPLWAQPFRDLCQRLGKNHSNVSLAFMELCEPGLSEMVDRAAARGASRIAVLPLFLAAGRHLREDVPLQITQIAEDTGLSVTLLPAIGEQEPFVTFLEALLVRLIGQPMVE